MARVVPRFLYYNLATQAGTVLTPSSAQPTFPVAWLRDQLRSKTWRSPIGWTVTAARNNRIDVAEGGVDRVAFVPLASYATPSDYATAVTTALNGMAGAVNTYACTYDALTGRFTIARASGTASVTLKWATGANRFYSPGKDLGFDVSADDSGLTSYTGDLPAYQSRQWIKADLGAAATVQVGVAIDHNVTDAGTLWLRANSVDAVGSWGWGLTPFSQLLSGDAGRRIAFFSSQSYRYWELSIEDVQNPAGFSQVGIWFLGPYSEPSWGYAPSFSKRVAELSGVDFADQGAHYQDRRARRKVWTLPWQTISDANRQVLEAVAEACPRGQNLFLALDAASPLDTHYGFFQDELEVQNVPTASGRYWNVSGMTFAEALG